ncbi:competence protein CoiA family protein [Streptomyces sp. NPDC051219]|uniref:competence protein CoiA family protein n=1 Tax=Streptomyces sp. NPDC051219 TaxID=3155283 RepID=UPI0034260B45
MPPVPADEEDTRKVQTAVAGGPGADRPVYLPMDAVQFDAFIGLHPTRDFYCGTLLGGCGKKLSARKYREKKCHFAHVASGVCRRTANDESSADHLYMGRALSDWLKAHQHRGVRTTYQHAGRPLRDAVDVSYDDGRRLLRVQLARKSKTVWEEDDGRLRGSHAAVEWLFGPDSMLANWQLDRQGYALRIRCVSVGPAREVEIGTQFPDAPVEWISLTQCSLTADGIVTPSLARVRAAGPAAPGPGAPEAAPDLEARAFVDFPLAPKTVAFTGAVLQASSSPGRLLYRAVAQPYGSGPIDTLISLPAGTAAPEPDRVHLLLGATLSLSRSPGPEGLAWLITADDTRTLGREAAQPWARLLSPHMPTAPVQRLRTPEEPQQVPPVSESTDKGIVSAVRETLEEMAKGLSVIRLSRLTERIASVTESLNPERWTGILVELERSRGQGQPLLTALIKGHGSAPAPFYVDVLTTLGRASELTGPGAAGHCERERSRVWAAYRPAPPTPQAVGPKPQRNREAAESERAAAFDALMDLAREAQHLEDVDTVDVLAVRLGGLTGSTAAAEAVDDLVDWIVDRRAEELYETAERLSLVMDRLDGGGDDLPHDHLHRLVREAEELAEEVGEDLAADESRHLARWRSYLASSADRPTLREIRSYASLLRPALRRAAREGRVTTWAQLGQSFEAPLMELHQDDKVAILVEVDRDTPKDEQPLSALIAARGGLGPHPLYQQVLFNLGRADLSPEAVHAHWQLSVNRHFGPRGTAGTRVER